MSVADEARLSEKNFENIALKSKKQDQAMLVSHLLPEDS